MIYTSPYLKLKKLHIMSDLNLELELMHPGIVDLDLPICGSRYRMLLGTWDMMKVAIVKKKPNGEKQEL